MTTPRALSLLAAFASPVFLGAAIAGWLYGVWPATPLTFGVACVIVAGGPVLGIYHVAVSDFGAHEDEDSYVEEPATAAYRPVVAPTPAPAPALLPLTPKAAEAKAFTNWRDRPLTPR